MSEGKRLSPERRAKHDARRARTTDKLVQMVRTLLSQRGFGALTVEGVGAASGIAKTTIYRRADNALDLALLAIGSSYDDAQDAATRLRSIAYDLAVNLPRRDMGAVTVAQVLLALALEEATADPLAEPPGPPGIWLTDPQALLLASWAQEGLDTAGDDAPENALDLAERILETLGARHGGEVPA